MLAVSQPHWACPRSQCVCPPCPHCSGSRLLCREPSEASPGLHAPPRSKPLRFRHSGSPQRRRLHWACVLCPSQVQAAQVIRCLARAIAATYHLPATRLSRCATGSPSQADVDRPDPQEVLVSKEACLQFYNSVSLGLRCPPSGSGCLSLEGEGLQPAISVQSFVLCAGLAVS